jgi:microcystin degradation protein MlrC
LTEYSDLLEAEVEEMETVAVMVKMAKATEMAVAVMTMAEKAVADITDGKGGGSDGDGGGSILEGTLVHK